MRSGKSRQQRKERAPLEEPVEEEVQLAGEEDEPELTVKEWLELHQLRSLFTVVKVSFHSTISSPASLAPRRCCCQGMQSAREQGVATALCGSALLKAGHFRRGCSSCL